MARLGPTRGLAGGTSSDVKIEVPGASNKGHEALLVVLETSIVTAHEVYPHKALYRPVDYT
jgi:hypothetical protein